MIYISHLIDDKEMKEIIASTGAGIESIEFSVAENLDHFSRTLKNYRKRLEFMNCQNLILHGPFLDLNPMSYDSLVVQATKTRYEQAYQAAKELGSRKLILHSGFIPSVYFLTGWAERMADFYNRFLDDKDDSVEILMENVMDPFPSPLKDVAERISHPAFGLCLDIGHANCFSEISGREWAEMLLPHIRHLHLHDNSGDKDRHLALGRGTVPLDEILKHFDDMPDVSYTIECNTAEDISVSIDTLLRQSFSIDSPKSLCYDETIRNTPVF